MPGKQDLYLYNMGELGSSRWMITVVFFLYSNYSRHFTRLRHTLKGVNLHCFLLFYNAEIGWMFCCMSHCFGLFFYSGQFKSCFPHQTNIIRTSCSLWAMGSDYFFISNQTNLHRIPGGQEKPCKQKEGHQVYK